jgi:hypothetical protein
LIMQADDSAAHTPMMQQYLHFTYLR